MSHQASVDRHVPVLCPLHQKRLIDHISQQILLFFFEFGFEIPAVTFLGEPLTEFFLLFTVLAEGDDFVVNAGDDSLDNFSRPRSRQHEEKQGDAQGKYRPSRRIDQGSYVFSSAMIHFLGFS